MQRYVVSRVLLAIPTLIGISMITFIGLRVLLPTSVVDLLVGEYGAKDEQLKQQLREELGLSSSVPVQYVKWMGQILHGDLGKSLHSGRPVTGELRARVPVSLELGLWGLLTALVTSIPMGVIAAVKQDRWPDYGLRSLAILLNAIPGFCLAILVITFGSIWVNWAP